MSEGRILIVDDNTTNIDLLQRVLQKAGYEVATAERGSEALLAAAQGSPELILLDIQMPEMDGYEVCTRLKADESLASIPVIFISALDDVFDKVKAFDVGGVDYVEKPFHKYEVLARVRTQLKLFRLQRELERSNARLAAANEELHRLSTTDQLTGLANRRKMIEEAEAETLRATRYGTPFTLVIIDIDRFKGINDTYGHDVGDTVLQHVATTLAGTVRATDLVARWGGEEFLALLRHTDIADGEDIAEKLRARLEGSPVDPVGTITASFGATERRQDEAFADVTIRADGLLYEAKRDGRNRVVAR